MGELIQQTTGPAEKVGLENTPDPAGKMPPGRLQGFGDRHRVVGVVVNNQHLPGFSLDLKTPLDPLEFFENGKGLFDFHSHLDPGGQCRHRVQEVIFPRDL